MSFTSRSMIARAIANFLSVGVFTLAASWVRRTASSIFNSPISWKTRCRSKSIWSLDIATNLRTYSFWSRCAVRRLMPKSFA